MAASCIHAEGPDRETDTIAPEMRGRGPAEQHLDEQPNVAVYLPRSTSLSGLAACVQLGEGSIEPLCLERNVLNERLKALTLYLRVARSTAREGVTHSEGES